MDIKTIATIAASIAAVIGVSVALWDSQSKLAESNMNLALIEREMGEKKWEFDKFLKSDIDRGCRNWERELLELMVNETDGKYSADLLMNISQADSYHNICNEWQPILWTNIGDCVIKIPTKAGCYIPSEALRNLTIAYNQTAKK